MHDRDGARSGHRLTSCGDCLQEFPGKTAQESADAARAHIEAGCPKDRRCENGQNGARIGVCEAPKTVPEHLLADDLEALLWD
jgi:hypothetical protein